MNNGQMNVASMLTAMPFIASEASAVAAVTMSGTPQNGSPFAKLLDVQQTVAKNETAIEPEKTEQPQTGVGNNADFINVALQMALAGYLQSGMPEGDNKQVQLPVDVVQNATSAIEQPAVTTDTAAATVVANMPQNAGLAVKMVIAQQQNVTKAIEQPQNVTKAIEQLLIMTDQAAATATDIEQNATNIAKPVNGLKQQQVEVTQTATDVVLSAKTESATDAPVTVQKQQQPEVARASDDIVMPAKTESVRPVATHSVSAALAADRFRNMAMAESYVASPVPPASIQQDEPHQITAGVAVAPVSTDKIINETLTLGARLAASPIAEKVVDLSNVKESTSTLKLAAFGSTPILDLESSNSNSQGESGTTSDNRDTAQNLQVQPIVEQHKLASATTKPMVAEPLQQEISEQVMPQVKESLQQHELKQGKQQITLTLSPENLGELKMNLNLQGGKLTVEIVTENRSVRDAIMQNVDTLKESLARQNITMESFDITTGGKGSANQGQNQNAWRELMQQQQQQQQQQQFLASTRGYAVAQSNSPSESAMQQTRQGESMLDIHY